jgi:hypothetical protein
MDESDKESAGSEAEHTIKDIVTEIGHGQMQ